MGGVKSGNGKDIVKFLMKLSWPRCYISQWFTTTMYNYKGILWTHQIIFMCQFGTFREKSTKELFEINHHEI